MTKRYRPLTAAETKAAHSIFADSLDYSAVRIYRGLPLLPFKTNQAIAPNGRIYFPPHRCADDFTCSGLRSLLWLIHELTHVWQWQNGFRPWLGGLILAVRGAYFRRAAYRIPANCRTLHFCELNMEQQAVAVEQLFALKHLPHLLTDSERIFQTAITEFADNPNNPELLPRYFCRTHRTVSAQSA